LFISLVGALGCSLLAFILPTAFHMKLVKVGTLRFAVHIFIVIVGFIAMVVSTAVTIQHIVAISK
jgi:amino acid permease